MNAVLMLETETIVTEVRMAAFHITPDRMLLTHSRVMAESGLG